VTMKLGSDADLAEDVGIVMEIGFARMLNLI
jgi:hypothetical protein